MIAADTFSVLLTLAIFILLGTGGLQLWHIYLISMLGSILSAFQEPAYSASISMIVPKEKLGCANGMAQMGQAITSVLTHVMAGALFVFIGFNGIIMIDFVTFFFAIAALVFVRIPQPERAPEHEDNNIWQDMQFGWNYLNERKGLLGLLFYYAMVNFLLNWSAVLLIPMVLSRFTADVLGVIQTVMGVGMLAGSILGMSVWGSEGGSGMARVMAMSAVQLRDKYLATGLVTEADVERYCRFAEDPRSRSVYYATVAVMGRRPA